MREIKFRGKRFDNNHNDWIYGHLHVIDTCGEGYTGKAIQQQFGTSRPYSVGVHPESVGQYTGLKDKNGKEIYEGDIIKREYVALPPDNNNDFKGVVEYGEGVYFIENPNDKYECAFLFDEIATNEVIGDIHEDKHLLEGDNQ